MAPVPLENAGGFFFLNIVSPSSVQTKALFCLENLWQQIWENNKISLTRIALNVCFIT